MNINQVCYKLQARLQLRLKNNVSPLIIGISGGQGSGKSTLSRILAGKFQTSGIESLILSLDDFYLTKNERIEIAKKVHPLAIRRGVPGTHDIDLLKKILNILQKRSHTLPLKSPIFEKGIDDRTHEKSWKVIKNFPKVIFLEGWCIGAMSDDFCPKAETEWELSNDPNGVWKAWTKIQAKKYEGVWEIIDFLIFIKQESFAQVVEDRWRQEQGILKLNQSDVMRTKKQVQEFCYPFESWTYQIWNFNKRHANVILERDLKYDYIWNEN